MVASENIAYAAHSSYLQPMTGPKVSRRRVSLTGMLLLVVAVIVGCDRNDANDAGDVGSSTSVPVTGAASWFEDVTDARRLKFVHDAGPTGDYFMPQAMGSGAALFDYDNDGRLDIYLIQNAGADSRSTNRLFHQTL